MKSEVPKTRIYHGIEFVIIPAGEFLMGSNEDEVSQPIHKVTIREPLCLSKYPVTQKQWRTIMGSDPSEFKDDDFPVEKVSWNDVQKFIKKLNRMDEKNMYRHHAEIYRLSSEICRLPSEAEWEYACKAGTATRYFFWR